MDRRRLVFVSDFCYESYPCQHDCEFLLADNSILKELVSGWDLVTWT